MGLGSSKAHRAAGSGDLETLADLVRTNPETIKLVNDERYTPLHAAALFGHCDCVIYLLAKGASADVATTNNATPLFLAATKGHLEIVRVLCDNGSPIDKPNSRQHSPLMTALYHQHEAVALELVHRGAKVDVPTKRGDTAALIARRFRMKGVYEAIEAAAKGELYPRMAEARSATAAAATAVSKHGSDPRTPYSVDSTAGTPHDSDDRDDHPAVRGAWTSPYDDDDEEGAEGHYGALEKAASRKIDGHPACLSCLVRPSNIVLMPCCHLCVCSECRDAFDTRSKLFCPKCREPVLELQLVGATQ